MTESQYIATSFLDLFSLIYLTDIKEHEIKKYQRVCKNSMPKLCSFGTGIVNYFKENENVGLLSMKTHFKPGISVPFCFFPKQEIKLSVCHGLPEGREEKSGKVKRKVTFLFL
jgi:hypothetical protein